MTTGAAFGRTDEQKQQAHALLAWCLHQIEEADQANLYGVRNPLVVRAVAIALELGLPAGFRLDPAEPEWPVAYIELYTGQVSWHLPQHIAPWDGHTTEQKYRSIRAFVRASPPWPGQP